MFRISRKKILCLAVSTLIIMSSITPAYANEAGHENDSVISMTVKIIPADEEDSELDEKSGAVAIIPVDGELSENDIEELKENCMSEMTNILIEGEQPNSLLRANYCCNPGAPSNLSSYAYYCTNIGNNRCSCSRQPIYKCAWCGANTWGTTVYIGTHLRYGTYYCAYNYN
mgnify:CR=1 FL=1